MGSQQEADIPRAGHSDASQQDGAAPSNALAWNSAFYRFAEAVRELTHGAVNYKEVYALVGTRGRYINHVSPVVRKRTAAHLSRLMHSSRYAADLRERFGNDPEVFQAAAIELVAALRKSAQMTDAELTEAFIGPVWKEIQTGLSNESLAGRPDINLKRVEFEHDGLVGWARSIMERDCSPLVDLISNYLFVIAFGCLDERFSRTLAPRTPVDPAGPEAIEHQRDRERQGLDKPCAYVARLVAGTRGAISGMWRIDSETPFTIGRYTDCDAIERFPFVSRMHCRIYYLDGSWYVQDAASSHGTRVLRGDAEGAISVVFDSQRGERSAADRGGAPIGRATSTCLLRFGDIIELAGASRYVFGLVSTNPSRGGVRDMKPFYDVGDFARLVRRSL